MWSSKCKKSKKNEKKKNPKTCFISATVPWWECWWPPGGWPANAFITWEANLPYLNLSFLNAEKVSFSSQLIREGLKKHGFYPHFVDKRFTPPPLSTSADFVIILQNIKYYPHRRTPPLCTLGSPPKPAIKICSSMFANRFCFVMA